VTFWVDFTTNTLELNFRQAQVADRQAGAKRWAFRFPAVHGA